MKNILTKIVLFIALCGGFAACKKGDKVEDLTYPIEFAFNKISIKNQVRLFVRGKEITDINIINNYLREDKNLFTTTQLFGQNMGKLKFSAPDTLEFPIKDETGYLPFLTAHDPWKYESITYDTIGQEPKLPILNYKYFIKKNNNQILFYSSKPVLMAKYILGYKMLKHTLNEVSLNSPSRKILVGYGNNNEINMSYLIYKYIDSKEYFQAIGGTSNEINENIIYNLNANDTLAVTTFSINYKKR